MRLLEHEGKEILRTYGVATPRGVLVRDGNDAKRVSEAIAEVGLPAMMKAQVFEGGRGKRGLVLSVGSEHEAVVKAAGLIQAVSPAIELLVEERKQVDQEWFVAISVDDVTGRPVVVVSDAGGVEVEARTKTDRSSLMELSVDPLVGLMRFDVIPLLKKVEWPQNLLREGADVVANLYRAFVDADAELVEVNPLVIGDDGSIVAVDAKVVVDDAAIFRHPEMKANASRELNGMLERKAWEAGLQFIDLEGDVVLLSMGAGNTMALMDAVTHYGGAPANFMDATGGQDAKAFETMVELAVAKAHSSLDVRAMVLSMVVAATPLKIIVDGLLAGFGAMTSPVPVFASIHASAVSVRDLPLNEALSRLAAVGIVVCESLDEAARRAGTAISSRRMT